MRFLLGAALAASIAGCGSATVENACRNLCDCAGGLPGSERLCVEDCLEGGNDSLVGQECVDCVAAASCRALEEESVCQDVCQTDQPSGR